MLPKKILFAQIMFISLNSYGYEFGNQGRSGANGDEGRGGGWGQDVTVQATGQVLNLNLSGRDGEDGRDGYDGEDATNCAQPRRAENNLTGANGGHGGDAGKGGNGGRGGNIIVYTNDVKSLAKITVYSEGGRGGRAGRPGNFGRGCRCSEPQWRVRRCSKDSNGKETCTENMYYCNDGQNGRAGQAKENGYTGGRGHLTLIPSLNPLPTESREAQINVGQILATKISLVSQVWQDFGGALQLFAPGSILADGYTKFMGMRTFSYIFGWTARKPFSDFASATMYLKATQDGVSSYGSRGFWYDSTTQRSGDAYQEVITRAMWGEEAVKMELQFSGAEHGFVAKIRDLAQVSDMLKTGFVNVVFKKVRPIVWDKTLFEGTIPATHILENNNQFEIRLGQLPDVDPSDLEDGNKITLKMAISRFFSRDYSTFQNVDVKHEIKK